MAREGIHRFTLKVEKEATLKLQSAFMKAIEPTKKEGHSLLIKLGK